MDIRKELRDLIENGYIGDFDYNTEYRFRTVYYRTSLAYCICTCGFNHEYVEYIQDTGDADETKFENVIECIVNGKCPHVATVPAVYVKETGVCAHHIAAVVCNSSAFEKIRLNLEQSRQRTLLFGLAPCELALMKNKLCDFSKMTMNFRNKYYQPNVLLSIPHVMQPKDNVLRKFERKSFQKLCVERRCSQVLKDNIDKFKTDTKVVLALQTALETECTEMVELIIRSHRWFQNETDRNTVMGCCELAILYDQPYYLNKILEIDLQHYRWSKIIHPKNIGDLCIALERNECKMTLVNNGCLGHYQKTLSDKEKMFVFINVLLECQNESLGDLMRIIYPYLKSMPNFSKVFPATAKQMAVLNGRVFRHVSDIVLLKPWINLGQHLINSDSDAVKGLLSHFYTGWLSHLNTGQITDKWYEHFLGVRRCLELHVYENPDLRMLENVVKLGFGVDKNVYRHMYTNLPMTGNYRLDGKKHWIVGHNDDVALNMMGPFLMECGFAVDSKTLNQVAASPNDAFPSEVQTYVQDYMNVPRNLQRRCRDVLRAHFKGRQIHHFVEKTKPPTRTRDFLLLKPLLLCVQEVLA